MNNKHQWGLGVALASLLAACSSESTTTSEEAKGPAEVAVPEATAEQPSASQIPGAGAVEVESLANYLALHITLADPQAEDWEQAAIDLGSVGDGFTLVHLAGLDRGTYSEAQRKQLAALEGTVRDRTASANRAVPESVETSLRRAVYADLVCHPLESTLPKWAMADARANLGNAEVLQTLQRMERAEYSSQIPAVGLLGSVDKRLQSYARQILKPEDE